MATKNNIIGSSNAEVRNLEGEVTVKEFKEWLRQFDADTDGQINRGELRRAIGSIQGWFNGWKKGRRGISIADANANGFIDSDEPDKLVEFARD